MLVLIPPKETQMSDPATGPTLIAATSATSTTSSREREELVAILEQHRELFLITTQGLSDEQARLTPTVSALSVGGLVKHVNAMVVQWLDFVQHGPQPAEPVDWDNPDEAVYAEFANGFRLLPDETLDGVLAEWSRLAEQTDGMIRTVDLDQAHPLPAAPWFAAGEAWSNRRVFMHLLAEISQHAGHADIVRESIDGQKTMG